MAMLKGMSNLLFVGLANPGQKYDGTRHNLGADMLRAWVSAMSGRAEVSEWQENARINAQIAKVRLSSLQHTEAGVRSSVSRFLVLLRPSASDTVTVHCMVPTTGMNVSGQAVAAYLRQNPLSPSDVTVLHDDLELPLGQYQYQVGGSARGHNGVRSIHTELQSQEVARLRVGIGRPEGDIPVDAFVLSKFTSAEQDRLVQLTKEVGVQLTAIAQRPSPLT